MPGRVRVAIAYVLTVVLAGSGFLIAELLPPLPVRQMSDSLGLDTTRLLLRVVDEVVPAAFLIVGVLIAWLLARRKRSAYRWLAIPLGVACAGWKVSWLMLMFTGAMVKPTPLVRAVMDLDVYVSWALSWSLIVLVLLILLEPREPVALPRAWLLVCVSVAVGVLVGIFLPPVFSVIVNALTQPVVPLILATAALLSELGTPFEGAFLASSAFWIPAIWFLIARSIAGRLVARRQAATRVRSAVQSV